VKYLYRVSFLVSFAAFLCFLPCASGQSTANLKVTGSGHTVLNAEPSNFFAFAITKCDDFFNNDKNTKSGCDSPGDKWGGKCAAAPEGGTSLMYLLLAGLSCLGGMVLRAQRQVSMLARSAALIPRDNQ
jgi:hypothetical protein